MTEIEKRTPRKRMSKEQLIAAVEAEREIISASRDRLRKLIEDADELAGDCDEAYEDLVRAIDTLSKHA